MSKGEILDLLYESDHKKFYSDSLCLQKAGSYLKTETIFTGTPQVIFSDGYGNTIGKATEYFGAYIRHRVDYTDADGNLLGTVELDADYRDRVSLVFRDAAGHEVRRRELPHGFKTRKMIEKEKEKEDKNKPADPPPGGKGGGSRTPDIDPVALGIGFLVLSMPLFFLTEYITKNFANWLTFSYQVLGFLQSLTGVWIYPVMLVLFLLTIRFPRAKGTGRVFLWAVLLAGNLAGQFFLSRQLGRMMQPFGLGLQGWYGVKTFLLCFLPSVILMLALDLLVKIGRKRDLSLSACYMIKDTIKFNSLFSGILIYLCRMAAAWAYQLKDGSSLSHAFRTVWFAALAFCAYWLINNSFDQ